MWGTHWQHRECSMIYAHEACTGRLWPERMAPSDVESGLGAGLWRRRLERKGRAEQQSAAHWGGKHAEHSGTLVTRALGREPCKHQPDVRIHPN